MSEVDEGVWKETADLMKGRLERLVLMDGIDVIVDQQKNLNNLINQAVAKLKGATVILFTGASPVDNGCELMDADFLVQIYGAPILRPDGVTVERLSQVAARALSKWKPSPLDHCDYSFRVTGRIELVPDTTYVIYEFPVRRRVIIPDPEFKPITPPPTDP